LTRALIALVLGSIVFATVYAAAASVNVSSDNFGAGDAAVSKCDEDGFTTVGFTTNESAQVTAVTIGDIADACLGGTMTVNLLSNSKAAVGAGSAIVVFTEETPNQLVVTISPTPATTDVKRVAMLVIGP
jgi:hypothetical protein